MSVTLFERRFPDLFRLEWEWSSLTLTRFETKPLHEDWIRSSNLNTNAVDKGEICGLDIVRTPAKGPTIDCNDERREAILLHSFQ